MGTDHFKKINDTWGHLVGDKVLTTTAALLSAALRNVDILARYGGEELVLLLPQTAAADARILAERLGRTCALILCPRRAATSTSPSA